MGFSLGPYFEDFIRLVRRLISSGSELETETAADGVPLSLHLVAGGGESTEVCCMSPGHQRFSAWLFQSGEATPRYYPPELPHVPADPVLVLHRTAAAPALVAIWFMTKTQDDLAARLYEDSLAAGWSSFFSRQGAASRLEHGLTLGNAIRIVLRVLVAGEPAVVLLQVHGAATA